MGEIANDVFRYHGVFPAANNEENYTLSSNIEPNWQKRATRIILTLTKLSPRWDSYDSVSVDPQLGLTALDILNAIMSPTTPFPAIVPTNTGGIQLEWHTNGVDLEINIMSDVLVDLYFNDIDESDSEIDTQMFTYDLEPLAKLTEKLVNPNSVISH